MNCSTWPHRPERFDSFLSSLFDRYLLGSLATGASKMGKGCIAALGLSNSTLARAYMERIEKLDVAITFCDAAKDVETSVEQMRFQPWNISLGNYFIGTRTEKDLTIKEVESLPEYIESK
ncbi:hypothetical protein [Paratractidigestivibacter faecalis]|uniref:Uncharacterized protein n=1 Tax=Paratractidigestivibacter faecalis TaxID=2292441 RepID=A0ABV1IH45_9ACTN